MPRVPLTIANRDWWTLGGIWLVTAVSRVINLHETHPSPRWPTFLIFFGAGAILAFFINDLLPRGNMYTGGLSKRFRPDIPIASRCLDALRLTAMIAVAVCVVQLTDAVWLAWVWLVLAALVLAYALAESVEGGLRR